MKMLKIKPNEIPFCVDIDDNLETLQREVGGYIEVICPFDDEVVIVCNEEGKLIGLPMNRALSDNGIILDVIVGDFLIVGETEDGDFASLTDDRIKKYTDIFRNNVVELGRE